MSRGDRLHNEKRIKQKIKKMVKETWSNVVVTGELLSPKFYYNDDEMFKQIFEKVEEI